MKVGKIKNIESTSIGKHTGKNDDGIYVGENFAAVFDGVSGKSLIKSNGKEIKIANIITQALKKIDSPSAPGYAKELGFSEFVKYINMYIKNYCEKRNYSVTENPFESTGVIYSKYHNQIWLVGDCRAVYDGNVVQNELEIDKVHMKIRSKIINSLIDLGYSIEELYSNDISKEIIANPQTIKKYVKDENEAEKIKDYIENTMYETLLECGFSKEEINSQELLKKYCNPKEVQKYLKNNPNVGKYGYSIFNGIDTAIENCVVVDLPDNVRKIKLSSDGFPAALLDNNKDLGYAIRENRKLAKNDILSTTTNMALSNAVKQSRRENHLAIDDESAVSILIEYVEKKEIER